MALFLLLILLVIETGFAVYGFTLKAPVQNSKKNWSLKRFMVNGIQIAVYLVFIFLPGVDFSFRFMGLAVMLLLRVLFAGAGTLIYRRSEKEKKKGMMVCSAVLSICFLCMSMVPAFLFTDYSGRPLTGPFRVAECEAILVDESRTEEFENDGSFREVPVHFYYPENIKELEKNSLPLVIFSHGAFGYYQSNASTYMELASNGYVVVSLDHPYHSFFTKDTSGKTIIVNPEFFQNALTIGNSETEELSESDVYNITSKWMELREEDMNFVIDELEKAGSGNHEGNTDETNVVLPTNWYCGSKSTDTILSVLDAVNYDKIGLMGHSLGGATAVTVGRREDVSAVIDLDGTMLGEETGVKDGVVLLNEEPYETPLLSVISEIHHNDEVWSRETGYVYANNYVLEHATCGYETYFKNTGHMNFTDLPLFSPVLAGNLGTGTVDAGECIDQINGIVLRFFDCYLKDSGEFAVKECY